MGSAFAQLVHGFGKTVGLDELQPDENGYLCLTFDQWTVNIEERDGVVYLYAVVGPLPAEGRLELYRRLLEANCFYRGTRGAVLGVDENLGTVMLFYQTPLAALDAVRFETLVENYVKTLEVWSRQLQETSGSAGPETLGLAAGSAGMIRG